MTLPLPFRDFTLPALVLGLVLAVWNPTLLLFVIGLLLAVSATDTIIYKWYVQEAYECGLISKSPYRAWQYVVLNFLPAILIWRMGYGLTPSIGWLAMILFGTQDYLYWLWQGKFGAPFATQYWMDWTPYGAFQTFIRHKPIQTWAINLQAAVGLAVGITSTLLL